MKFEDLMREALELEKHLETEWAEENSALYDAFADKIEREYDNGNLTDREFNDLACTAFYDYMDLKEEEED